jgi:hypothetical protein
MNVLKQIVIKATFTTALVVVGLTQLPANADSQSKECTHGPNNRVVCTTSGSSSTRSSSSSSRTTTNVDVNVSEKDVENLLQGIFNNRSTESYKTNQNLGLGSTNQTYGNKGTFGW